jgi:hypothetical protein
MLDRMVHLAMDNFPTAFPFVRPEAEEPSFSFSELSETNLDLLADACSGLACAEDLDNSPFELLLAHRAGPLQPIPEDGEPVSDALSYADSCGSLVCHEVGIADLQDGEEDNDGAAPLREVPEAARARPPSGVTQRTPVSGLADPETAAEHEEACFLAAAAAHFGRGHHAPTEQPQQQPPQEDDAFGCDGSMYVATAIAEAEMLFQMEEARMPVEATAQLSLPMFPELPLRGDAPAAEACSSDGAASEEELGPACAAQDSLTEVADSSLSAAMRKGDATLALDEPCRPLVPNLAAAIEDPVAGVGHPAGSEQAVVKCSAAYATPSDADASRPGDWHRAWIIPDVPNWPRPEMGCLNRQGIPAAMGASEVLRRPASAGSPWETGVVSSRSVASSAASAPAALDMPIFVAGDEPPFEGALFRRSCVSFPASLYV